MPDATSSFTVTFVDGVTLDKWRRRWAERVPGVGLAVRLVADDEQLDAVRDGSASMGFVRDLPDDEREWLHHIPLYRETPVVVVNREHPAAAYDEIAIDELADEIVLDDPDLSNRVKVETVAAGTGIVVLPLSVARMHHRKDVAAVPVLGVPESQVGLAWRRDDENPLVETFVGIVRGRTAASSRGAAPSAGKAQPRGARPASPPDREGRGGRQGRQARGGRHRGRGV